VSRRLAHIAVAYVISLGGALAAAVIALRVGTRLSVAAAEAIERSLEETTA
jgi:hypothetical protein